MPPIITKLPIVINNIHYMVKKLFILITDEENL